MLHIPTWGADSFTIIGHDPGTVRLGVCFLEVDIRSEEVVGWDALTLKGDSLARGTWDDHIHEGRMGRIYAMQASLRDYYVTHRPLRVASEAPFFSPGRPMAYGALTEVCAVIGQTVREYDAWMRLMLYEPNTVKNGVGAKGGCGKEEVQTKVISLLGHLYKGSVPITELDEHSIDSVAVAYTDYLAWRQRY